MGLRAGVVVLIVVLSGVVAAGCGSSSGSSSSLDPASIAPANSSAYIEFTVRPQGDQRAGVESALTKLLGHSPDAGIQRDVNRALRSSGLNYQRDVQPWLGQRVGLAVTAFSRTGFAVIAPTNDTGAAQAALTRAEKRHGPLSSGSYRGVSYKQVAYGGSEDVFGTVGHYEVLSAGPAAFDSVVDASKGSGLASQPSFNSAFAALPSSSLTRAYANGTRFVSGLMALPTVSAQVKQALRSALANGRARGTITLSLGASASAFTLEAHTVGSTAGVQRSTADVSALPGQSWLALSTGAGLSKTFSSGFERGFMQGFSRQALARGINPGTLLKAIQQRTGISLNDLVAALGGFQLSVQGSSLGALGAGIVLHPQDPQAAVRLLAGVHKLLAKSKSLSVSGGAKSFTVTKPGLPIPRAVVSDLGREVVATLDLPSFAAIVSPSTTLNTNPVFQRARRALLPGSNAPLFVNFAPLATLLSTIPQFQQQPRDKQALAVIQRLDYFVVAFNSASRDFRVILGLH